LIVWLDFLDAIGSSWDCASVRDVEALKDWRITDLRNDERIRPLSFDTDRAALNSFYTSASSRYGVFNAVPTVQADDSDEARWRPGPGYTQQRRDPLRPAGSRRRQVEWLLRAALEQWRNIGLRAFDFNGLRRDGWRGFNEDRDCAFVDGLYGTGLRVREWASVLDVELPASDAERPHQADRSSRTERHATTPKPAHRGYGYQDLLVRRCQDRNP
jgi:hypothetical protein